MLYWPYNYHAHTPYGDGHSPAADYGTAAVVRKMQCIGISEHAPLGADVDWTMDAGKVPAYRAELEALREQHRGELEVLLGLECDWWAERPEWYGRMSEYHWDFLIGSVHMITRDSVTWAIDSSPEHFSDGVRQAFRGDIRAACDAFFSAEWDAAASGRFDILGHFDLVKKFNKGGRYFDLDAPWYKEMAASVVEAAAQSGTIVEINTAGLDKPVGEYYPAPWLVARCVERGVRLTLSADAHSSQEIRRHFDRVCQELPSLGVRELWRLTGGEWSAVPIA